MSVLDRARFVDWWALGDPTVELELLTDPDPARWVDAWFQMLWGMTRDVSGGGGQAWNGKVSALMRWTETWAPERVEELNNPQMTAAHWNVAIGFYWDRPDATRRGAALAMLDYFAWVLVLSPERPVLMQKLEPALDMLVRYLPL